MTNRTKFWLLFLGLSVYITLTALLHIYMMDYDYYKIIFYPKTEQEIDKALTYDFADIELFGEYHIHKPLEIYSIGSKLDGQNKTIFNIDYCYTSSSILEMMKRGRKDLIEDITFNAMQSHIYCK